MQLKDSIALPFELCKFSYSLHVYLYILLAYNCVVLIT